MNYLYEKIKWPPALRALGERRGTTGNRIYYLAVPPAAFEEIVGWVGKHKSRKGWTRVIVEKPFGHDLQSAQDLNVLLHKQDRKSTRLNSSHGYTSYAVFCLKKKNITTILASERADATVIAARLAHLWTVSPPAVTMARRRS